MHDIRWIRNHPAAFDAGLKRRRLAPRASHILALDELLRARIKRRDDTRARRNHLSGAIGSALKAGDEKKAEALKVEVNALKDQIGVLEQEVSAEEEKLSAELATYPNLPDDEVPDGKDETDNQVLGAWGKRPDFAFTPRDHHDLGTGLGLMDFETAARMSGARFVVLKGALAQLERALGRFMLDVQSQENGYEEMSVPILVRTGSIFGTGHLPKFADDQFASSDGLWLIPTAEVPLTNLAREQIVPLSSLPFRFVAQTPCFRREAGSAGRDTRGMLRQHQFYKVELVSIVDAARAQAELDHMVRSAEMVLQRLELPYQRVALCTADLGFSSRKTVDLEVWLPAQNCYREISSCSCCDSFQARRMQARYRDDDGTVSFVHTLNGSGVAVGRALIAVMENYQNPDGSIRVPKALVPYMRGLEVIGGGV